MSKLLELYLKEPTLINGCLNSFIALLLSFGLNLSHDQVGSILAFSSILLAVLARTHSTPNVKVDNKVDIAVDKRILEITGKPRMRDE